MWSDWNHVSPRQNLKSVGVYVCPIFGDSNQVPSDSQVQDFSTLIGPFKHILSYDISPLKPNGNYMFQLLNRL
jgi:hypothetical protein